MNKIAILSGLLAFSGAITPCFADYVSPGIDTDGRTYSTSKPDSAFFGSGPGGKLSEASMLRFKGQQYLEDGKIERAYNVISKAVQLDPGDPDGHMLYAHAITAKFYGTKGTIDEKLLGQAIDEWKMIWHHDADSSDQLEAKAQCRKLMRIAKALSKQRKEDEKAGTAIAERPSSEPKNEPKNEPKHEPKSEPKSGQTSDTKSKQDYSLDQLQKTQNTDSKFTKLKSIGEDVMEF